VKIEVPCFIQKIKKTGRESGFPEFFQNFFLLFSPKAYRLSYAVSETLKNRIDK